MFVGLRIGSTLAVVGIGDAADTLSPNIGQGGGSMMNALSLAVHLDRGADTPALAAWEAAGAPHHRSHAANFRLAGITRDLAAAAAHRCPCTRRPIQMADQQRTCTVRPGRNYQRES
jgi:2-polyprenyl-6-methoxyphenol hydroxylase-like FAD-dependent oxidoreductase